MESPRSIPPVDCTAATRLVYAAMAYIRVTDEDEARDELAREYEKARRRAGRVYNVLKVQGLRPAALREAVRLYMSVMHGPGELTRPEREMLAVVVSAANECHY